jgi:hypothetical protein
MTCSSYFFFFGAAFFLAGAFFLVAFNIDRFSLTSNFRALLRERGCVPFIRFFEINVKKKMHVALARTSLETRPKSKNVIE